MAHRMGRFDLARIRALLDLIERRGLPPKIQFDIYQAGSYLSIEVRGTLADCSDEIENVLGMDESELLTSGGS